MVGEISCEGRGLLIETAAMSTAREGRRALLRLDRHDRGRSAVASVAGTITSSSDTSALPRRSLNLFTVLDTIVAADLNLFER